MGGEPYTWRRVRTVRRQAVGNLSPKGDKAPTAEPTCAQIGRLINTSLARS